MASINGITSQNVQTQATLPGSKAMGKDDFLTLLVAQLMHQDPLNPANPTEFTAQLAQFSSLEQLFSVNDNLKSLTSINTEQKWLSALSLIGREVTVMADTFKFDTSGVKLGYDLDASADSVTLTIKDEAGRTVQVLKPGERGAGEHFIEWDGRDQNGQLVTPGKYNLVVSATVGKDQSVPASPLISGLVTGVDMDAKGNVLLTSAGVFSFGAVKAVRSI